MSVITYILIYYFINIIYVPKIINIRRIMTSFSMTTPTGSLTDDEKNGIKTALKQRYNEMATDAIIEKVQVHMASNKTAWKDKVIQNYFKDIISQYFTEIYQQGSKNMYLYFIISSLTSMFIAGGAVYLLMKNSSKKLRENI